MHLTHVVLHLSLCAKAIATEDAHKGSQVMSQLTVMHHAHVHEDVGHTVATRYTFTSHTIASLSGVHHVILVNLNMLLKTLRCPKASKACGTVQWGLGALKHTKRHVDAVSIEEMDTKGFAILDIATTDLTDFKTTVGLVWNRWLT